MVYPQTLRFTAQFRRGNSGAQCLPSGTVSVKCTLRRGGWGERKASPRPLPFAGEREVYPLPPRYTAELGVSCE